MDRGLGAFIGHALRVPMAGTSIPAMGDESSGIRDSIGKVYVGHTCDGCQLRTIAVETHGDEDARFGKDRVSWTW